MKNQAAIIRHADKGFKPETFCDDKLSSSIQQACYMIGSPEGSTSDIASKVVESITQWLTNKPEITNDDLRHKAGEYLEQLCPEGGYFYRNQKNII